MRGIRTRQAGNRGRALNYLNNNTGADCYGLRPVFRFAVIVFLRPKPHLQSQSVGNHRDKFAIGGFALDARDRVAEVILQGFDVTAVPRDLDRVPGWRAPRGRRSS